MQIWEHDEQSDDENDISWYEEASASASCEPEGLAIEPSLASSTRARMEQEEHEDTEPRMEQEELPVVTTATSGDYRYSNQR